MQKEFILCAAINYDGKIICGHRHGDCYKTLTDLVGELESDKLPSRDHQGFLTSKNRYVGREEAWVIAKANEQIVYGLKTCDRDNDKIDEWLGLEGPQKSILISENLY